MRYKTILFLLLLCLTNFFIFSCRSIKEIPVQTIEKIIYHDSLVYIHDSVQVIIPYEVVKEVIPIMDTSILKTSYAKSIAYIDTTKKKINHTLTQEGKILIKYDTIVQIQTVDKIIERDVPIEVEVIKYKRDTLFWVLAGWAVICILYLIIKLKI